MELSHLAKSAFCIAASSVLAFSLTQASALADQVNDGAVMYANSDFIEKEQPALSDETKQLIALYQQDPSMENYLSLRATVIENYNAVLARKEAKLASLIDETAGKPGGDDKVAEMEDIVQAGPPRKIGSTAPIPQGRRITPSTTSAMTTPSRIAPGSAKRTA